MRYSFVAAFVTEPAKFIRKTDIKVSLYRHRMCVFRGCYRPMPRWRRRSLDCEDKDEGLQSDGCQRTRHCYPADDEVHVAHNSTAMQL